jgi:thiamine-phosphate diphosphorylase
MICLVTDRRRLSAGHDAADRLVELVAAAARAGVDLIQVRERDLAARDLVGLVRRCLDAVSGTPARVLVNDRVDVALAARAHGVHLRADSIDAPAARAMLPPNALVGQSIHSVEEAAAHSRAGGVDYLILGTLFPTASKDATQRLTSLDELSAACRVSAVPVLAIGGISVERAPAAARAGASGVASVGVFIPPDGQPRDAHVRRIVADLRRAFDTCGAVP